MSLPIIFSLIFYTAFATYLFWGVVILSFNIKSLLHRIFFGCCLTLSIWAFAFSISNSAPDAAISLCWRRVAALGWGSFYSFMLHFILVLTEKNSLLKKKWIYLFIYSPAVLNIFVFSLYNSIAIEQYEMVRIYAGWVNVSKPTVWDGFYQLYYASFTAIVIGLVWNWGGTSREAVKKKQAYMLIASFVIALLLGTLTEYIINFYFSFKTPQLAPVIVLIPIFVMFFCIVKYGLIAPRIKSSEEDGSQILSEVSRIKLYRYLGQAYILGAFVNFATQYFNNRESLESALLFSAIILLLGLILQLIQSLNIKINLKDALSYAIMTASIPLIILKYIDQAGFYALSVPIIFVMASIA